MSSNQQSEGAGFHALRQEAAALLRLGLPVIGAQLAQIAMNFVDTVMAGTWVHAPWPRWRWAEVSG